ncbi:MAG: glycosyltransferase family 2 protein [Candidatus Omnitrophica bacterium]|nr:glycosyltransferase family 2 protein [Candidatus Omnitrophota bacterium]
MISVIIPVFNEQESLKILQKKLHKVMARICSEYEIIYVDDGSTDYSLKVLKEIKRDYPLIKVISFKKNQGQSTALFAGFKEAKGDWIITLDADLQNPPEEISKFLEFKDDFDFITGIRTERKDSFLKKISSGIARFFRQVILKDITKDTGCSLRMFKKEVIEHFPAFRNSHRFFPFLARSMGFKVKEIPVQHNPRKFGKSKYGILKRGKEGIFDLWGVSWLKRRLIKYASFRSAYDYID